MKEENIFTIADDLHKSYGAIKDTCTKAGKEFIDVWMGESASTSDPNTFIGSSSLAACTGIAVVARDINSKVHRFVAHASSQKTDIAPLLADLSRFLSEITNYSTNNENLKSIEVNLVSSQRFRNKDNYLPQENFILNELQSLLKPFPHLIGFKRAFFLALDPAGELLLPDPNITQEYLGKLTRLGNNYDFRNGMEHLPKEVEN